MLTILIMYQPCSTLLLGDRPVVGSHLLALSDRLRLVCSAGGRAEMDTHISLPASHTAGVVCCNRLEPHTCWKGACPRAPRSTQMEVRPVHANMRQLRTDNAL